MKGIILSNLRLKLLSLAFAMALWFFVTGQSNTEVGFLVPVGFKQIPKTLVMTSAPPAEVEVRVMGPKLFINNLSPSQIVAEIDLSDSKEGLNSYRLLPKDVVTPMGIEVMRVRPSSLDIRMERLITVNIPVKVRLSGKPAAGFRIIDVTANPKVITASGVKKEIKELTGIYTKPIDVSGLNFSTTINSELDIPANEFRAISSDSAAVRIRIEKER